MEAEEARKNRRVMKVPKGMSDYQATWIVDDCDEAGEEEEDSCDDDDDDDDAMIDAVMDEEDDSQDPGSACDSGEEEEEEEEEELCSTVQSGADQRYDQHMDETEEGEGLKRYREARANEMFPDEVDTPLDVPAKTR